MGKSRSLVSRLLDNHFETQTITKLIRTNCTCIISSFKTIWNTAITHCLAALLPLSKCVTLMYLLCYFFPLNLSHYYTSSLVGMKKTYLMKEKKPQTTKPQTTPTETTQLPRGLKAEFQGKSSCIPCQKESGTRNIQWNTHSQTECRKIPPS